MKNLKYESHFTIEGKDVYVIRWSQEGTSRTRSDMMQVIGEYILIDGKIRKVLRFETTCLLAPLHKDAYVGIMVEDATVF